MLKGSALNLTDVFLWKFLASWNRLSCRAVFISGNRNTQLAFTILQFARKYFTVIAEWAEELCKSNQHPFLQMTAPVCRYPCSLCIHRPQTVCRGCLSPLPLQNYQHCFVLQHLQQNFRAWLICFCATCHDSVTAEWQMTQLFIKIKYQSYSDMFNGLQASSTKWLYVEWSQNAMCIVWIDTSRSQFLKFSLYVSCSLKVH